MTHTMKNFNVICAYLQMSLVQVEVPLHGYMFGGFPLLKFDYHELSNLEAFSALAPELYLKWMMYSNVPKFEPMPWACGLACSGILNFLHIPHSGCYNITGMVVRQLLTLVHDGCLWIQGRILNDAALIH